MTAPRATSILIIEGYKIRLLFGLRAVAGYRKGLGLPPLPAGAEDALSLGATYAKEGFSLKRVRVLAEQRERFEQEAAR